MNQEKKNNRLKNKEALSLSELLRQRIKEKNFDIKKLSLKSGLEEKHCQALVEEDFSQLPPDIYVRGCLFKIAQVLDLNSDELWEKYKKEKKSVLKNNLPFLEFKNKKTNYFQITLLSFIFLISFLFIFFEASYLFVPPKLTLSYPKFDLIVNQPSIKIKGQTNASIVFINNRRVKINKDGEFEARLSLLPGLNIVKIEAENKIGKKTIIQRKIIYQK